MNISEITIQSVSDSELANMIIDSTLIPTLGYSKMMTGFSLTEGVEDPASTFEDIMEGPMSVVEDFKNLSTDGKLLQLARDNQLIAVMCIDRGWFCTPPGFPGMVHTLEAILAIQSEVDKRPEELRAQLTEYLKGISKMSREMVNLVVDGVDED
jgi:hypothetical protein